MIKKRGAGAGPGGGASETGGMSETGVALGRQPGSDNFMTTEDPGGPPGGRVKSSVIMKIGAGLALPRRGGLG